MSLPTWAPPEGGIAQPFWDGVAREELLLPRCSLCHGWQWYPSEAGVCCAGAFHEWVAVSGRGTIHTYTYVRRAFLPNGAADVPYAVVFVDLDDAPGVRFVGNLLMHEHDDEITIGLVVDLSFVRVGGRAHPVFVRSEAALARTASDAAVHLTGTSAP